MKEIQNTEDGVKATPEDVTDIQISNCLNCYAPYDPKKPIMFTRLSRGKLLWWHQHRCAKKTRSIEKN